MKKEATHHLLKNAIVYDKATSSYVPLNDVQHKCTSVNDGNDCFSSNVPQPHASQPYDHVYDNNDSFCKPHATQRNVSNSSFTPSTNTLRLDMFETDNDKNDIRHNNKNSECDHDEACDELYENYDDASDNEHNSQEDLYQNDDQDTLCLLEPTMTIDDTHLFKFLAS